MRSPTGASSTSDAASEGGSSIKGGRRQCRRPPKVLPLAVNAPMACAPFERCYNSTACGSSSVGRAFASQAKSRGFESRLPLQQQAQLPAVFMPIVTVLIGTQQRTLTVPLGANLRRALLAEGISPYAPLTRRLNCGGRGLCATCGVCIVPPSPEPTHWHDQLAQRFGYPRLSCQITVNTDLTLRILSDKRIWGTCAS